MLGNEEDFSAALGFDVTGLDEHISNIEAEAFKKMIEKVVAEFPFKVVATTLSQCENRDSERLGCDLLRGWRFSRGEIQGGPGNLRSGWRRRLLCLGLIYVSDRARSPNGRSNVARLTARWP